jgi:hypothetical protein
VGLQRLRRAHTRARRPGVGSDGAVHLLDDTERAALTRLERFTVMRAGFMRQSVKAGTAA